MKNILTLEYSYIVHIVAYADTKANLLFLQYEDDEGTYLMDITKDDIDYMFSRKGYISMRVDRVPSECEMNGNVNEIVFTSSKYMIKKFRKFVLDMLDNMQTFECTKCGKLFPEGCRVPETMVCKSCYNIMENRATLCNSCKYFDKDYDEDYEYCTNKNSRYYLKLDCYIPLELICSEYKEISYE